MVDERLTKFKSGNCKLKVLWLRKIVRDLKMKIFVIGPNK